MLEHKLGMLEGLDPVLENIVQDLNEVTNFNAMDFMNHIWDVKNADLYGTIEGSSNRPDVPIQRAGRGIRYMKDFGVPYRGWDQHLDDMAGKAAIGHLIDQAVEASSQPEEEDPTDEILRKHIHKLKSMVGKTATEKKLETEIK